MATINLMDKWAPRLEKRFTTGSITDKWCGTNWEWTGVNTLKTLTLLTDPLNDYNPAANANRFGTMTEVDDEANSYTLTKKRSFDKAFDETNVQDQNFLKKGAAYLKQMWDERYVPEIDTYRFARWADGAGLGTVATAAISKTNIVEALLNAHAALDDAGVPMENRVTFIRSDYAVKYKLADEFKYEGAKEFIQKRQIGEVEGSPLIKVPKNRFPAGVAFMVKYKQATADPVKMRMLRAKDDSDDLCGVRMQGLVRYDSFVLAQSADGIYVYGENAGNVLQAPTFSTASNKVTITSANSASIKYTTDGTNPKTSATAQAYSTAVTITENTTFRAYAYATGKTSSAIGSYDAVKT